MNNYFNLFNVPERIQQEIDTYNNEKLNDKREERYDDWTPEQPYVNTQPKVGRNDPCPCGSGKKYKKCCLGEK